MVQALVNISERANRVLNIIKATRGLKDKSEAIDVMADEYEENLLEPQFRPEFIANVQRIRKGQFVKIKNIDELSK
ncbi:MAG: DUF2683 family protein [Candidatus Micrarchaeota archaeon]